MATVLNAAEGYGKTLKAPIIIDSCKVEKDEMVLKFHRYKLKGTLRCQIPVGSTCEKISDKEFKIQAKCSGENNFWFYVSIAGNIILGIIAIL